MAQQVKGLALSLLLHRFDSWLGDFYVLQAQLKEKKKKVPSQGLGSCMSEIKTEVANILSSIPSVTVSIGHFCQDHA